MEPIFTGSKITWVELYGLMQDNSYNNSSLSRAMQEKGFDMHHVNIARYLTGKRTPSDKVKETFANFFDVKVEQLG